MISFSSDYRSIPGFSDYLIRSDGQVFKAKTGKPLTKSRTDYEFYQLTVDGTRKNVSVRKLLKLAGFV